MSREYTLIFHLDITIPTIDITTPQVSDNGKVSVEFSVEDLGIDPSGIKYITLSWGNNLTINVTSLSSASMQYRYSGSYTITITAFDNAGNNATQTTTFDIVMPETKTSKTKDSPISLFAFMIPFSLMTLIIKKRKNTT